MKNEKKLEQSNLAKSSLDPDFRDLFAMTFTTLNISESYDQIYKQDPNCSIPKRLIELYIKHIKPDYNQMIFNFKRKYVCNESLVEKNDTKEQRQGLGLVYDYIQKYNINEPFNIFLNVMKISSLLWKPTDEKNNGNDRETEELREKIVLLKKEARETKSLSKLNEARQLQTILDSRTHKARIGGVIRTNNTEDEVRLYGSDFKVPTASEALDFINGYLKPEKMDEFNRVLKESNIIAYISYCVKEMCNFIYYQPFMDGNKRTARSLLNLMFKARGLPPVYIKTKERDEYKKALFKGIKNKDYKEIIGFYLFKICDSIYELDILPYRMNNLTGINDDINEMVSVPKM